jgi:hypothetical protein
VLGKSHQVMITEWFDYGNPLAQGRRLTRPLCLMRQPSPSRDGPTPLTEGSHRSTVEIANLPSQMTPGETVVLTARITNRSPHPWPRPPDGSPTHLVVTGAGERVPVTVGDVAIGSRWLRDGAYLPLDDGRRVLPLPIEPGGSVDVALPVTAPDDPGDWSLSVGLVNEMIAWFGDLGDRNVSSPVTVVGDRSAPPVSRSTRWRQVQQMHAEHGDSRPQRQRQARRQRQRQRQRTALLASQAFPSPSPLPLPLPIGWAGGPYSPSPTAYPKASSISRSASTNGGASPRMAAASPNRPRMARTRSGSSPARSRSSSGSIVRS